jgi:hypothetical protein
VSYFAIAVVGLILSLMGFSIALVQMCRRRPGAAMLVLISLPGGLGCAYHTWRLWS